MTHHDLTTQHNNELSNHITQLNSEAKKLLADSLSGNTKIAYIAGFKKLAEYMGYKDHTEFTQIVTGNDLVNFISDVRIIKKDVEVKPAVSTIKLWLSGIRSIYDTIIPTLNAPVENPCDSPLLKKALKGYTRQNAAPLRQAKPLVKKDIDLICNTEKDDSTIAKRNRALLLLGFCGLLRRSEIVAINIEDVQDHENGLIINIFRSKTQSFQQIPIHRATKKTNVCPVQIIKEWRDELKSQGIVKGGLIRSVNRHGQIAIHPNENGQFLTAGNVAKTIKKLAEKAGLDDVEKVSGHSLRSGGATELAISEVALWKIMQLGDWTSPSMVTNRYVRSARIFDDSGMDSVF